MLLKGTQLTKHAVGAQSSLAMKRNKTSHNDSHEIERDASASNLSGIGPNAGHGSQMRSHQNNMLAVSCMDNFGTDKTDEMVCIILIKSGTLILNGCSLSVEGIKKDTLKYKAPCIY